MACEAPWRVIRVLMTSNRDTVINLKGYTGQIDPGQLCSRRIHIHQPLDPTFTATTVLSFLPSRGRCAVTAKENRKNLGCQPRTYPLDIQLDSGNQHLKYWRRFWQLWCVLTVVEQYMTGTLHPRRLPKDPPSPPSLSLDDAKPGNRIVPDRLFH